MVDTKTRQFIEKTVRENFTPEDLHAGLRALEEQVEEAEGDKKIVIEAFILGIRRSLGKV